MTVELTWDAPGAGDWWLVRDHFPYPMSSMFSSLFPAVTAGWKTGGARYGMSTGLAQWGSVNGWIYYGPEIGISADELAAREVVAATVLAGATPWRDEVRRWHDDERPATIAANLVLQRVDPAALDDVTLSAHLQRTIENFRRWAPLHFEHIGFDVAAGLLLAASEPWGIDGHEIIALLAGGSPASAAIDTHLRAIAAALDAAGAPAPVASLDEVRHAGPAVGRVLDEFLLEFQLRPVAGHDLREPTLGERPDLVVASLNARRRRPDGILRTIDDERVQIRRRVPEADRARFDELLDDARAAYALRDDDVGICWNWPVGLIRHAALEAGRRLLAAELLEQAADVFEVSIDELPSLLAGRGPSSTELARRRQIHRAAVTAAPLAHLHGAGTTPEPLPRPTHVLAVEALRSSVWSVAAPRLDAPLHGIGVGATTVVGPARMVREPDQLLDVIDGDILVAIATTTAFNAVFGLLAGVVTATGDLLGHTAILARELGLPAVVGVGDLFDHVREGDIIELDATVGSVRVVDRPG